MFDRFVTFRARQSPFDVAISMPGADVTFADFDRAIGRVAAALAAEPRPALAAVRVADPYFRWLAVLALARLGVASATVLPGQEGTLLLVAADLVIADIPEPAGLPPGTRWLHVAAERALAVLARKDAVTAEPRRGVDPEALGQVVTSSGSTGLPKPIGLTWRCVDARMRNWLDFIIEPRSLARVLPVLGAGSRSLCLAAWTGGGRVLFPPLAPAALAPALAALRPTCMVASPIQLRAILDALPPDAKPIPGLRVVLIGSHAPLSLRRDAAERLTRGLVVAYGTNETDVVAHGLAARLGDDEAACGWLMPSAEAEVVDEAGQPLPAGEAGLLRLRGPEVVDRYWDKAARSAAFRDSWYSTGDLATLSADGALRIEGRADDRMNFGGVKVLPRVMEAAALSCPGVRDAAAFAVPGADGFDQPWLALVRDGEADDAAVGAALRKALPGLQPVWIATVADVPRNMNGKVERHRLREAVIARSRS